jgi:phasin family protein
MAKVKTVRSKAATAQPVAAESGAPKTAPVKRDPVKAAAAKPARTNTAALKVVDAKPLAVSLPKPAPVVTRKPAPTKKTAAVAAAATVAPPRLKEMKMTTETMTKSLQAAAPAMEKATADAVAQAQAGYAQMNEKVQAMMEKNMKSMTEMTEFAKGNVEAMIESAKAATAGAEKMTAHFVETSKTSMEEAQAALKAMTGVKTPNELMQYQTEFAKTQFDKAVASWSQLSESWMKLAGEVVQPLSNRMAIAGDSIKKNISA